MANRILVTGAAGFIGSHLSEALLARGDEVVGLDNFNDFYDPSIKRGHASMLGAHGGFRLVEGDIRDAALVGRLFADERPTSVVHLAAMAGVRPSLIDPVHYHDVNCTGTTVLLEAARNAGVQKFVFGSSSSVYGGNEKVPFARGATPSATGRCRRMRQARRRQRGHLLTAFCHLYRPPGHRPALRLFTVYGPRAASGDGDPQVHAADPGAASRCPFFGDGTRRARDYTYVERYRRWNHRKALDQAHGGYRIYNLGELRPHDQPEETWLRCHRTRPLDCKSATLVDRQPDAAGRRAAAPTPTSRCARA